MARHRERPAMAIALLIEKSLLICQQPMRINGALKTKISTHSGICDMVDVSIETPVTPPSIKRLGNRNAFKPNPAERIPKTMNVMPITSRINIRMYFLSSNVDNIQYLKQTGPFEDLMGGAGERRLFWGVG